MAALATTKAPLLTRQKHGERKVTGGSTSNGRFRPPVSVAPLFYRSAKTNSGHESLSPRARHAPATVRVPESSGVAADDARVDDATAQARQCHMVGVCDGRSVDPSHCSVRPALNVTVIPISLVSPTGGTIYYGYVTSKRLICPIYTFSTNYSRRTANCFITL